jgi:hypothetical protein
VRLSNGYSLWNHVNAVATAWGRAPRLLFLVQERGKLVGVVAVAAAAVGVFGWLQVTGVNANVLNALFGFFVAMLFNFLSSFWPSENSRLENSFLAIH